VRTVFTSTIKGYFDSVGTFARPATSRVTDRAEQGRLAEEQAALRRVATLVARGAPSSEVFEAVAHEVAQVLGLRNAAVSRYDDDGEAMTVLATYGDHPDNFGPGSRWPLVGQSMSAKVLHTGRPARIEDYAGLEGPLAAETRRVGFDKVAGAPIMVGGRVWGVISTSSSDAPLPDRVEDGIAAFTELVATAIANSQARDELTRLAEEQAALRRVATLVAEGASPDVVFDAVCGEVAQLVPADAAALTRYEDDGTVAVLGGRTPTGYDYVRRRFAPEGTISGLVSETRRPSRISYAEQPGSAAAAAREMGWHSSVGAPITVEGRLWGVLAVVSTANRPLPVDTERRLAGFTQLVATAIANTESREELAELAEEQAALRRVATLVAQGARPAQVFQAVSAEVGRLVPADAAALSRYEADGTITPLGEWTPTGGSEFGVPVGERLPLKRGTSAWLVFETRRPARVDGFAGAAGRGPDLARAAGWRSSVAAPIIVEGRLWGVVSVGSKTERLLPPETEERLREFTELLATAIANAESHEELDASRARILATADATRRRIERDLHDGAQQQLVSLALELRAAQAAIPAEFDEHRSELSHVIDGLTGVLDGLREIALGIHPPLLAEGGLEPALKTLARRSPIPVELDVQAEGRLPEPVEVAAYYVVSEALTNAAKYARASVVHVDLQVSERSLRVAVRDDGLGGADPARGSGLLGLKDRAEAIGGTISLRSPHGAGTSLQVELPLDNRNQ
jgi:signal transduction histidine kinase/uncharacterized protein YoaH (UPF0181 family)